jgi:hypothetical protein
MTELDFQMVLTLKKQVFRPEFDIRKLVNSPTLNTFNDTLVTILVF